MIENTLHRVSTELTTVGYSLTSFTELGLPFDQGLADKLSTAAAEGVFSSSAAELTERIPKDRMTMVQGEEALNLGRRMVAPVVETLFVDQPAALSGWSLYALNRYETGGNLGAHQDSVDKSVMIVTASGVRRIDMYGKGEAEGAFGDIERQFWLGVGSIMVLDAEADCGHALTCEAGPSVSAVLDVPGLLRPAATPAEG